MKKALILTLICCLSVALWGQSEVTLSGKVTDKKTKEALLGATISTDNKGTVADLDGNYTLSLPAGKYNIKFTYTGYEPQTFALQLSGKTMTLDIEMSESENLLQEATITGSKFEKPLGEQSVSMEVLKPKLIDNYGGSSIDKVMDKIPGVDVVGGQANIRGGAGFSGNTGSRVLMLIDDIPALQADLGLAQWQDLPQELTERIEVLKGASSALYGSSALNGILNLRTVYPTSKPVTKFALYSTAYMRPALMDTCAVSPYPCRTGTQHVFDNGAWRDKPTGYQPYEVGMQFMHARRISKWGVVAGGNFFHSKGWVENTGATRGRADLKLSYHATERLTFGLNGYFNFGKQDYFFFWKNALGGQHQGELDDPTTSRVDTASSFISGHSFRFNIDPTITYFDAFKNKHRFVGRIYASDNYNINQQSNSSNLYYGDYQFSRQTEKGLSVIAGISGNWLRSLAEVLGNQEYIQYNISPYLQLESKIGKRFTLTAGVRYEYNYQQGADSTRYSADFPGYRQNPNKILREGRPVFRVGGNYRISDGTFLRASWGTGYRIATLGERYLFTRAGSVTVIPNPQLKSETGWSAELGIKQGVKFGNWQGFFDLAAFVNEYDNMIELVIGITPGSEAGFNGQQAFNIGNTRIAGLEATLTGQGKIGLIGVNLLAGYTYINPIYREFGELQKFIGSNQETNVLKNRFRHTAKFDIEASYKKISIAVTGIFRTAPESIDRIFTEEILVAFNPYSWARDIREYQRLYARDFWVFDVRAAYQATEAIKVSVMYKNALNSTYTLRPASPEAPANITLRLDASF